jgi:hypothetical protein
VYYEQMPIRQANVDNKQQVMRGIITAALLCCTCAAADQHTTGGCFSSQQSCVRSLTRVRSAADLPQL